MSKFLEINNLTVRYGGIHALKNIDFYVEEGEIVSLIGANGAGKSSTLNAISSVIPYDGEISFCDGSLNGKKMEEIVQLGVVQVPEGRHVFPAMTVYENLELGGYSQRKRNRFKQNIERVYHMFPRLNEREKQLAGTLSGGEQQMLALGRALMADPKLIMMDEPSLGLAPLVIDQIFETLQLVRQEGISILLVEQNASKALEVANRCYLLETGSVVLFGTAEEVSRNPKIQEVYLGATG